MWGCCPVARCLRFRSAWPLWFGHPCTVLCAVVLFDALGWLEVLPTAGLGVTSLLLLRTITVQEALDATRPRILLMIASSFALGAALQVRLHAKG